MRMVARCGIAGVLLGVFAGPAAAQQAGELAPAIAAHYSGLRDEQDGVKYWDRGFGLSFSQPIHGRVLSLVGEFSWHHNDFFNDDLTAYQAGARLGLPSYGRLAPFFQTLVGAERCCSNTGFSVQPGAGANLWLAKRLAVQVQFDFRLARYAHDGSSTTYHEPRAGVGIVVPLTLR